jgi:CubicO group peptidase (beta-lactamase class C family)
MKIFHVIDSTCIRILAIIPFYLLLIIPIQKVKANDVDDIKKINAVVEHFNQAILDGLTGQMVILKDGAVNFAKANGYANEKNNKKIDLKTVFDLGSNTKQFTATAILKLLEEGKVSLNAPLKCFFENIPIDKANITIHQLLTHSSGLIANVGRDWDYPEKSDFLNDIFTSDLISEPGTEFHYSNIGYSLLALIIESVSGMEYEHYLKAKFFDPIGMQYTGYQLPDWKGAQLANVYRRGYEDLGTIVDRFYKEKGASYNLLGNGGIHSSASDLILWFNAIEAGDLLSSVPIDLYTKDRFAVKDDGSYDYGYGWSISTTTDQTLLLSHTGSNGLFWSSMYWFPSDNIVVLFNTNAEESGTSEFSREIRKLLTDSRYMPVIYKSSDYTLVRKFVTESDSVDAVQLQSFFEAKGRKIDNSNVLNRLGFWYFDQGRPDWGLELLKLNSSLFPADGNLWDSLGEGYILTGKFDLAKMSFEQALMLANSDCGWCDNAKKRLSELANK